MLTRKQGEEPEQLQLFEQFGQPNPPTIYIDSQDSQPVCQANPDNWLTSPELATRLNVSLRTVERGLATRGWPCHHVGRSVRFDPEDVAVISRLLTG